MITSDIETLEVFYAHTISPVCIAVPVSACVFCFVGAVSSWAIALSHCWATLTIGIVVPVIASGRLKASGVRYGTVRNLQASTPFFWTALKASRTSCSITPVSRKRRSTRVLWPFSTETKKMKHDITKTTADRVAVVCFLYWQTLCSSASSVANSRLFRWPHDHWRCRRLVYSVRSSPSRPARRTDPDLASGDRVLNLFGGKPAVTPVTNGRHQFESLAVNNLSFSMKTPRFCRILHVPPRRARSSALSVNPPRENRPSSNCWLRFWQKDSGEINLAALMR